MSDDKPNGRWTQQQADDIAKAIVYRLIEDYLDQEEYEDYDERDDRDDIDPWFNHGGREGGCSVCQSDLDEPERTERMRKCPSAGQIGDALRKIAESLESSKDWRCISSDELSYDDIVFVTGGRYAGRYGYYDNDDNDVLVVILDSGEEALIAPCNLRLANEEELKIWGHLHDRALSRWYGDLAGRPRQDPE